MSIADKQLIMKNMEQVLRDKLTVTEMDEVMKEISQKLLEYDVQVHAVSTKKNMDFLKAFLDAKRIEGRSAKTISQYRYVLTKALKVMEVETQDVTVYHLRSYFMSEKDRGVSDRTLDGNRSVFSSYFGWLYKEKLINDNPCANIGSIKCLKKVRVPFSSVDIERLKETCSTERDKALVSFLLSTGCRISEVCKLNRDDIDFQRLECTVLGKGNKERTVFLDDVTAMQIQRYLMERRDDSIALFVGKGTERMTAGGVRFLLKSIGSRAGVENVHPHRFRRTLATNLIDRGMPIHEVANILGHDNINTTMTYVYINKENVKNAYRKYA